MASKNVMKLVARLKSEFGIDVNPENYYTTRAGKHMRAAGAYLWVLWCDKPVAWVGGCEPMRKYLVKRNRLCLKQWSYTDIEVYAYAPDEPGYKQCEKQVN